VLRAGCIVLFICICCCGCCGCCCIGGKACVVVAEKLAGAGPEGACARLVLAAPTKSKTMPNNEKSMHTPN